MKTKLLFLPLFVVLASCINEDTLLNESLDNVNESFQYYVGNCRSFEEVVEIAESSISMLQESSVETRGAGRRTLNLKDGVKFLCKSTTRANNNGLNVDTLLYVFNFNDDQGFAIVSANRNTEPLIAVVESGSYNPDSITGNPAFDTYMRMANYYVSTATSNPETVTENINTRASANPLMCRLEYDTIYNERIEPKISVRWGQESRMGQFCPNGFSGCANTAIAQIMSYYKYPNSIQLTYTGRDSNSSVLDWCNMCNHISTYWPENRDQYDIQIGRLARQLGVLSHSTYHDAIEPGTTPTTGTTPQNARSALTALGYNIGTIINYTHNQNHYIDLDAAYTISNGLRADRLVYMFGYGTDSENHTYGHAWVIDGGIYMKTIQRLMATYDGVNWTEYREMATYRTCLNHINWGWNGNQNGYFVATVLNPHLCEVRDPDTGVIFEDVSFYDNACYYFVWR